MRWTKITAVNVALLAVAGAGGGLAYASVGTPKTASTASIERTATIASGTVMTTISTSGNVTAPGDITVNFTNSGKLTEVDAKTGDQVKQGQVLARIDATAAQTNLDAAKAQLASAQEKLTELVQGATAAQRKGYDLSNEQAAQQVTAAQNQLANAQQQFTFDQTNLAAAVTKAQQQLASDQTQLTKDNTTYVNDESTLGTAVTAAQNQAPLQYAIDAAQSTADAAQQTADCAAVPTDHTDPTYASALAKCDRDGVTVLNDQSKLTGDGTAGTDGKWATSSLVAAAITNETNGLAKDQNAIDADQVKIQADKDAITAAQNSQAQGIAKDQQSITSAQQQVTNAQLSEQVTNNNNAQQTAPPKASDVASDQAAVEQAQVQVDNAQQALDATALTAPTDGTVGAVNYSVGETVSAGNTGAASAASGSGGTSSGFLTLTNLTELQVTANIDEADAAKVLVNAPATVTLNALPNEEFAAHVIQVANTSTVSSNVVQYQATFALDQSNPSIKPGMTANVTVITGKADGVLNVPSAAVRSGGRTSYVLVEQADGSQKQVDVVVGLKGDTSTQIEGAVKAGDKVALPATTRSTSSTTTNPTTARIPGGGVFIGGGGGFGGGGRG